MRWSRVLRRRRAARGRTVAPPGRPPRPCACSCSASCCSPPRSRRRRRPPRSRPIGEVIVKFRDGERSDAVRRGGLRIARTLPIPEAAVARVRPGEDAGDAVARLERDPRVAWAEPNVPRHGASLPNDPFLGDQWALDRIGLPQAWERTIGSPDVRVAIVDSGVNLDQPDLAANLATNPGESGGGRRVQRRRRRRQRLRRRLAGVGLRPARQRPERQPRARLAGRRDRGGARRTTGSARRASRGGRGSSRSASSAT